MPPRTSKFKCFLHLHPHFHTALFLFESFDNAAVFDAAASDFQSKRSLVVSLLLHIVCHSVCCCLCVQRSRRSGRCSAQVGFAFWWVRHFAFLVLGHVPTCRAKHIVQSLANWEIWCHKCSCSLVIFDIVTALLQLQVRLPADQCQIAFLGSIWIGHLCFASIRNLTIPLQSESFATFGTVQTCTVPTEIL